MQFKHPEILWALLVLLIPIIIHLFQLRRFKKTPFTNVAMLQQVVSESRKSNTLKKWLLLLTRLALLACLIIAFAQPFFANKDALKEKETIIYLDDSFSMQSKKDGINLMEKAVQDILNAVPKDSRLTLFTNSKTYSNTTISAIQNELLSQNLTNKQLSFAEILFKAKTYFSEDGSSLKNLILISDFQTRLGELSNAATKDLKVHLVQMTGDTKKNIAIDSVYLGKAVNNQIELQVIVSGLENEESLPISLFDGHKLIAKTAVLSSGQQQDKIVFSIPENTAINGRLVISDNNLSYDNQFYFTIEKPNKIKVLSINEGTTDFLNRIYTEDEFDFVATKLNQLNYSTIESQNLVILNGLEQIPSNLQTALNSFKRDGGSLVIIPGNTIDVTSYNTLLGSFGGLQLQQQISLKLPISGISFEHPLYQNVFEKKVTNFEYPEVNQYYKTNMKGATAITYANGAPFLINTENTYLFTAPLNSENSNFQASPLVVPTFYNLGALSLKKAPLYFSLGNENKVAIAASLEKDNIISLYKDTDQFIPRQQVFPNKIELSFLDKPEKDGIYAVTTSQDTLQRLSFNYKREESNLVYHNNMSQIDGVTVQTDIIGLFDKLAEDSSVSSYWKWFVIFTLIFALLELLIQKFLA